MDTDRKPTIVRITATDAPRDTIVALLLRSRTNEQGLASRLTQAVDGYYYAVIDHPDTLATFEAALDRMVIGHAQVDALPRKPKVTPTSPRRFHAPGQRDWTGDVRVDAAISKAMADLFAPSGVFGTPTGFGSARTSR